jgi:hypothetical protein
MTVWANILFLVFVVFLGMFMTHLAIRHERLREGFRGGFGSVGGSGGYGSHNGGGYGGQSGGGHGSVNASNFRTNVNGSRALRHRGHYNFEHCEDQGRRRWREPIEQPQYYPGGGATMNRNWKGSGKGNDWPFVWWGPAWYPEYAYICKKDSDCVVGKCGTSGFCVV